MEATLDLHAYKQLISASTNGLTKKMMLRPDQKLMKRLINVVSKFYRMQELVLDTCKSTLATLKMCLKLPTNPWSTGSKADCMCFQGSLPSLAEAHAKHILSARSDKVGSKKMAEASRIFVKVMTTLAARRRFDSSVVPLGIVTVKTFLEYVMYFLRNVYKDVALFEKRRHMTRLQCSNR